MKKLIIVFLFLFFNFIYIDNIEAKVTCHYQTYSLEYNDDGVLYNIYKNGVLLENIVLHETSDGVFNLEDCDKFIYANINNGETIAIGDDSAIVDGYTPEEVYDVIESLKLETDVKDTKAKKVSCGNVTKIPAKIPKLTSEIVTIIQVLVPVILVIVSCIDLVKGIASQKDDEIKKGQQLLIKRIIAAVIIFFVIVLVKFVISITSNVSSSNIIECIDCFVSNSCNFS